MNPEKLDWVESSRGHCPKNAIHGGVDAGNKIYVARASFDGIVVPGKLHTSHSCAYIPYNMEEVSVRNYEVLCGPPACVSWVDASRGDIPENAVPGGLEADGEVLYIGRVIHNGTVTVGKVHPSHGVCYIPYGGGEHAYDEYEILVRNKLGQFLDV